MTPEVIGKLEQAFLMGCTDLEACFSANISKDVLYDYQAKHPEFADRKERLKSNPVMKARQAMLDLMESKDEGTKRRAATDTLNRYDGKPKDKVELTGAEGKELAWTVEIVRPKDIDGEDTTP
jgi:hypothetical protein